MILSKKVLLAFDLDGTLTQHKSRLSPEYAELLSKLSQNYCLLMVGAGSCTRIYAQMNNFPITIIGNYGMEFSTIDLKTGSFLLQEKISLPVNIPLVTQRAEQLRQKLGYMNFIGDTIEIHKSGMLTFPILGTKADLKSKLSYDANRKKRRAVYEQVVSVFPEYNVYIGGSSSFDIVPKPYSKLFALDFYCKKQGLSHSDVLYFGDDYGFGGNDEDIYTSDIPFEKVDNYKDFPLIASKLL